MREASGLETIDGLKYIASTPAGEFITGMVMFEGKLIITTDKHIYTLEDSKRLKPMEIVEKDGI